MKTDHHGRWVRYERTTLGTVSLLLAGGALLAWAWNASVGELFDMPRMSLRQALAAEVLVAILSAVAFGVGRCWRNRTPRSPAGLLP